MKKLLNVSNHILGMNQLKELEERGYVVIEMPEDLKFKWAQLAPTNYPEVCNEVIQFAEDNQCEAMHLAGFPPAVSLICLDINKDYPLFYAYSERESIEVTKEDGTVEKKNVFRHKGFFRYVTDKSHLEAFKN